ncbi:MULTISPECIES: hypothetical protein [Bacillus cereus group]|uniref:hypothetical protein n=1 Tax=Bacillus cereus group TaxID=86661 RepID=UPI000D95429B|nr:hypothetical protein [Bacillus cereus]MCU4948959.1 hypothetical protein [Bacillus cereus]SPT76102.1 Uncharacterised protein [Bacillus cereus]
MKYKDRKDAKRKYKQALLATVVTITVGVSAVGGTTPASAAEKTAQPQSSAQENRVTPQGRYIQGHLIKDGIKKPVYSGQAAGTYYGSDFEVHVSLPQLPSNPTDPVPDHGSIKSETGNIGSILYFSFFTVPGFSSDGEHAIRPIDNAYVEKKADGSVEYGTFDPKTLVKIPEHSKDFTCDPSEIKKLFEGTKVKRETAYQLIDSNLLPRHTKYTYTNAIKSGTSTENAIGGALTLGYKLTTKLSGDIGIAKAELAVELSAQLQATYNHKVTVTEEKTTTKAIEFPGVVNSTYNYNQYRAALYQVQSTYTVEPGPTLVEYLNHTADLNGVGNGLAQKAFAYSTSDLYLATTPGADK